MNDKQQEITDFGRRVREALEHASLTQQAAAIALTNRTGRAVKQQTVQHMSSKAERSSLTADLAALTGFSYAYLAHGTGAKLSGAPPDVSTMPELEEPTAAREALVVGEARRTYRQQMVPLISYVAAGHWSSVQDPYAVGDAEDWLPCPLPHSVRTYALRIKGESMYNLEAGPREPSYADGDIIFVDPEQRALHGDDVVVRLEDQQETTFKQLIEEGAKQYLKARNPNWPNRIIEITGPATFCGVCIGKLVDVRRRR